MDKLLLRVTEAAEMTSVGRSKAYELVAAGPPDGWPAVHIGRSVRVPVDGLVEWVERQKQLAGNADNA